MLDDSLSLDKIVYYTLTNSLKIKNDFSPDNDYYLDLNGFDSFVYDKINALKEDIIKISSSQNFENKIPQYFLDLVSDDNKKLLSKKFETQDLMMKQLGSGLTKELLVISSLETFMHYLQDKNIIIQEGYMRVPRGHPLVKIDLINHYLTLDEFIRINIPSFKSAVPSGFDEHLKLKIGEYVLGLGREAMKRMGDL